MLDHFGDHFVILLRRVLNLLLDMGHGRLLKLLHRFGSSLLWLSGYHGLLLVASMVLRLSGLAGLSSLRLVALLI